MSKTLPFYFITAFSNDSFAGNPAAVVFVDDDLAEDTETLMKLGANLSQPISLMVYPPREPSTDPKIAKRRVRFMTNSLSEVALCGHGSLAVAGTMFAKKLVPDEVEVLELETKSAGVLKAYRKEEGWFDIELPSATLHEVPSDEARALKKAMNNAFGRVLAINYIGRGRDNFAPYLVVELDAKEDLKASMVDANALKMTGYNIHVITTDSITGEEAFISRAFAPAVVQAGEDHVSGSTHSLLVPYWFSKKEIPPGDLVSVKQVSQRGGSLRVHWEKEANVVHLQGQTALFAEGTITICVED
ncbi:Diaminopimelate epimerase-like protein [Hymenopellis radicata]|nr:Diaminopimelate epimerase-like protein [Hymenopellis radicata]